MASAVVRLEGVLSSGSSGVSFSRRRPVGTIASDILVRANSLDSACQFHAKAAFRSTAYHQKSLFDAPEKRLLARFPDRSAPDTPLRMPDLGLYAVSAAIVVSRVLESYSTLARRLAQAAVYSDTAVNSRKRSSPVYSRGMTNVRNNET